REGGNPNESSGQEARAHRGRGSAEGHARGNLLQGGEAVRSAEKEITGVTFGFRPGEPPRRRPWTMFRADPEIGPARAARDFLTIPDSPGDRRQSRRGEYAQARTAYLTSRGARAERLRRAGTRRDAGRIHGQPRHRDVRSQGDRGA